MPRLIEGPRFVLDRDSKEYPEALLRLRNPPQKLYVVGNCAALQEGLAIVGARKATPYGIGAAQRFAALAAKRGVPVISGGARGCDAAAHTAALEQGSPTVVFLGGGCDKPYPKQNLALFERVVRSGGAVVSEHEWDCNPRPWMFRDRNRLIAGLAKATLIVEAGLPSGTFSTADEALAAGRDVWVVPGSIMSAASAGSNRLLYQGAVPVIDDETFLESLDALFGPWFEDGQAGFRQGVLDLGEEVRRAPVNRGASAGSTVGGPASSPFSEGLWHDLYEAVCASPLDVEQLYGIVRQASPESDCHRELMAFLAEAQRLEVVKRYPDGKWGAYGKQF